MQTKELTQLVIGAIEELKGIDILTMDVIEKSNVADMMVIATGRSDRHVRSIAENVVYQAKQKGEQPLGHEGTQGGNWVLVDLGDVLVHVMTADAREFYSLEKLWSVNFKDMPAE